MTANLEELHEHICQIGGLIDENHCLKSAQEGKFKKIVQNHINYLKFKNEFRVNWAINRERDELEKMLKFKKHEIAKKNKEELLNLQKMLENGISYYVFYTIKKYDFMLNDIIKDVLNE